MNGLEFHTRQMELFGILPNGGIGCNKENKGMATVEERLEAIEQWIQTEMLHRPSQVQMQSMGHYGPSGVSGSDFSPPGKVVGAAPVVGVSTEAMDKAYNDSIAKSEADRVASVKSNMAPNIVPKPVFSGPVKA